MRLPDGHRLYAAPCGILTKWASRRRTPLYILTDIFFENISKKIHTTELNFKCTECDKAFKTAGRLRFHMSIHTGYKPFACEFCDKRFRQNDKLKEHIRIHTGEKPYKCPHCDYACVQRGNLKKHINNRHKNVDTAQ